MRHLGLQIFFLLLSLAASAQQKEMPPLSIDPNLCYGKLPNGMTYYIRHNNVPEHHADFYLAQNVGSILEENNQRGFSHFLEHMAFEGTKNFPGHGMDAFTTRIGMHNNTSFNAYTSFDETVYMLVNAPMSGDAVLDSCLLILHDWSAFLTLSDSAIARERKALHEEWQSKRDAQYRLWEQQLPKLFPNNRYAQRLPIGDDKLIDSFRASDLRTYYKKWYHPDMQAIVVVGDIDTAEVKHKIMKIFADIPSVFNPIERQYYLVPDNTNPLVSVATDNETKKTILTMFYKHNIMPRKDYASTSGLMIDYIKLAAAIMMNERLYAITQKSNPPFTTAEAQDGDFMIAKTKEAWTVAALIVPGKLKEGFAALVHEMNKLKQTGFTQSEYERARATILKNYDTLYKERNSQDNSNYANECVKHFTDGGYIPGIAIEKVLMKQISQSMSVERINQYIQKIVGDKNLVIALTGPEKSEVTLPSENELLAMYENIQGRTAEPYSNLTAEAKTENRSQQTEQPIQVRIVPKNEENNNNGNSISGTDLMAAESKPNNRNQQTEQPARVRIVPKEEQKTEAKPIVKTEPKNEIQEESGTEVHSISGADLMAETETQTAARPTTKVNPSRRTTSRTQKAESQSQNKSESTSMIKTNTPTVGVAEDSTSDALIKTQPKSGRIVSEKNNQRFGTTTMTLGNGVKVVIKQTDFHKDEVLMKATSPGGSTIFDDFDISNLKVLNDVIKLGGLGNLSAAELDKQLSGKRVSCTPSIGTDSENLNGSASLSDLRTLFELIYLNFTAMRRDNEAFASYREQTMVELANQNSNPMVAFADSVIRALYLKNPRAAKLSVKDFSHISYDKILKMYNERFANAGDFIFTFVGSASADDLRPFIVRYLASLPSIQRVDKPEPNYVPTFRPGHYTESFTLAASTPKAVESIFYTGQMEYSLRNLIRMDILKQSLDIVFDDVVGAKEGDSDAVNTLGTILPFPEGQTLLRINFKTDIEKLNKISQNLQMIMQRMAAVGPTATDFRISKSTIQKRHDEEVQTNNYWLNVLEKYYFYGFDSETEYINTLSNISITDITLFTKKLISQDNIVNVNMTCAPK